jgi:hypothetical protein
MGALEAASALRRGTSSDAAGQEPIQIGKKYYGIEECGFAENDKSGLIPLTITSALTKPYGLKRL